MAALPSFAQLSANFSADPLKGCAPIRIVFTDQSSGNPDRWRWDLGNGTISTAKDPSTTYFNPGVYTIRLTVYKGSDSAVAVKTNYISVFAIPTVSFSGNPLAGCAPLPVAFTDRSQAGSGTISSWRWDFGDGNLSTLSNPVHTYTSQGKFKVTLTLRNSEGCVNSASIDEYVSVLDSVGAKFNARFTPSCLLPIAVNFTDASVGRNIVSWQWDFGDGNTSTVQNPTHTYTASGTYDVRLIVTNASGCSDTLTRQRLINAGNLKADFETQASYCANQRSSFPNSSTPVDQIDSTTWQISDGTRYKMKDLVKVFATPGTYTITQTVYFLSCSSTTTKTVTVVPSPGGDFTASPNGTCKPPLTVNFTNSNPAATVLRWDFGNGQSSTDPNATHTYVAAGSYMVKMILRHASGCIDTIAKPGAVNINPPTVTSVKGLPYDGCFPYTATFDPNIISPEPIVRYEWDFGDGTTSNEAKPTKTYTVEGGYRVNLYVVTASGCSDTVSYFLRGSARPKADFEGSPPVVCPSTSVFFRDKSTGQVNRWKWFFGDGGTSDSANPSYLYNDTGNMTVRLIAFNNGCADTITKPRYIYVNPPLAVFTDSFTCEDPAMHYFTNKSVGALRWNWDLGDGTKSNNWDINHRYADTGRYVVVLQVEDNLCKHTATKTIYVFNEEPDFIAEGIGGCNSDSIRFTAKGPKLQTNNISLFEWTFNDGIPITSDTNLLEIQLPDSTTQLKVKLKIWDLNGCVDSITKVVPIIFQNIKANFGPAFQNVCLGELVTFTDSSRFLATNPVKKWIWNFGNSVNDTVFTQAPHQTRYYEPGIYDIQLIVEDAQGCRDTLLRQSAVVVHNSIADFETPDTLVCLNTPVVFTNLSIPSNLVPLTYQWNFGDGRTSTDEAPTIRYTKAGIYDISLIIRDVYGCRDTMNRPKYITVADAKADFELSDSFSTCPPLLVNFTNKSASNIVNQWDFGNGNSSILTDPSHTYTFPGIFKVKLKVTGNGGCSDSLTKQVRIQGPSGIFTYAPLGGCPPLEVTFTANAINTKFYTWDFSDGQSDVTSNATATHTYAVPGTFVPRLILEDGLGCKLPVPGPDTIRVFITDAKIGELPRYTYCDSATISFTDATTSTDGVATYKWNFGDGATSTLKNPVHFYARPGRYRVTLEVTSLSGCYKTDTLKQLIVVAQSPQVDYTNLNPVCLPADVQFTGFWLNPDTSAVSYSWDFGDGRTSNKLVPDPVRFTTAGTFNIALRALNNYGCTDTVIKPLVVNDTPRVVASPATDLCRGSSVRLNATGALSYTWDPQRGLSCFNCATPLASPDSTIIYRVAGSDANGCVGIDTVIVRVIQPGRLSVGPGDTICVGESVQLRSLGYTTYAWSPAAGLSNPNINNPVARPTVTTRYKVVGSDPFNCFADSGFVQVVVYPIPTINIVESFIQSDPGAVVPLRTLASNDVTRWRWTPTGGLSCSTCPEPFVTINKKQKYTADVVNAGGCRANDEVTVEPTCIGESIFVPNTFSPNSDGRNDVFFPRGKGLNSVKRMQIFNRWGEVMYERTNFLLNDPTAGWDGTYKGVLQTPDVYVYLIDGVCGNNQTFNLKGNVTLLR